MKSLYSFLSRAESASKGNSPSFFKSFILTLAIFVAAIGSVLGQIGGANATYSYVSTQTTSTYASITGGTAHYSTTATSTDGVTAAVNIGFNFNFNGRSYSQVFISNNGFITFGVAPGTANYTPLSNTTASAVFTYEGAISGFCANLAASTVAGAAPEVRSQLTGTAPNRVFIIQYKDIKGSGAATTQRLTFQIQLKETSNVIDIVYGAGNASGSVNLLGQVGVRGSSQSDFSNRTGINWTTATIGTTNTNQMTLGISNGTTVPEVNLCYRFTPPAAMAAPTYAALPYTENFNTDPWSAGTWLQSLPSTTSVRTWPGRGDNSWRRDNVTVGNSGWTGTSGGYTVATPAASGTARFHSFNTHPSIKGNMDFHLNFSTAGAKVLTFNYFNATGTDNLVVLLSTDGGATFGAALTTLTTSATWSTQTVQLGSSTATSCVLRFQATSDYGDNDIGVDNVSITVQSCASPTALAISNITSSSASVSWTAASPAPSNNYEYAVTTSATPPASGTANATTSASATGLTANTTYYLHVRSNCGGSGYSGWATSAAFFTGYCTPTGFSSTYYISNVTTTGGQTNIANATASNAGYGNFTAQSASNSIGTGTSFTVAWSASNNGCGVWINWNNDLDFADANEQIAITTTGYIYSPFTGTINIPAGTPVGSYRMRIVMDYNTNLPISCPVAITGETEDYTFTVTCSPAQPSAITGTLNPEVGSSQTYSVTDVAGVSYAWSFPSGWVISGGQGTNSVTVTVGGTNGTISVTPSNTCSNGTARTATSTIPNYRWKYISSSLGSATWTGGEARNVSITIKNTGVATWNSTYTNNIGVRWNSTNSSLTGTPWSDFHSRVTVGSLAAGASGTITLPIEAKNATAGPVYSTNLADGTYYLAFDMVSEGQCWFSGNTGTCGPGNTVFYSAAQTVSSGPTISCSALTAFGNVCSNATSTNSFTVSGVNLSSDVNIAALSGYSYSTSAGGTYSSTLTLTPSSGSLSQTIYVKFTPTSASTYNGSISVSSTGATSQSVSVSGAGISAPTVNAGSDFALCSGQTVALNGSTNASPTLSSLFSSVGTSNGSNGVMFNIINTSGTPLTITGLSQGSYGLYSGVNNFNIYYYPGSYVPVINTTTGWVQVAANAVATVPAGGTTTVPVYSGSIPMTSVTIPVGATYGFYIGATGAQPTLSYTTATGTGGSTAWGSDASLSITVGHGGAFPGPINTPRAPLIKVNYSFNPTFAWSPATALSATNVLNPNCSVTNTTTYTLTVTSTNGCSASDQVVATIAGVAPATPTAAVSGSSTINVGGTTTLTSTAANTIWYTVATGGSSIGTGSPFTTAVQCTPGTITYYAEDNNGTCASGARGAVSFTVRPIIGSNPSNALICSSGGSVTLSSQLTGGSAITWSPSTNLSTTSGASTVASPTATTVYTMSATVAGCGSVSATQAVGVIDAVAFTPTSTPTAVCAGNTAALASNLASSGFTYATTTFGMASPSSPTNLASAGVASVALTSGNLDDGGWQNIPIGFSYNFFGNNYTTLNVGTNGVLLFGAYNATSLGDYSYATAFPTATEPTNVIAAGANDFNATSGTIRYWIQGIAPTRTFVVEWNAIPGYVSGTTTSQIKLFETTGNVEIHISNNNTVGFGSITNKVVGLQNADASVGATAYSSTATITNTAWKFIPGANYTFQWATAGSNVSGATLTGYTTPNLSTPGTVTYSVAATNPNTQCTTTQSVNVTVNALPAAPNSTGNVTACSNSGSQPLSVSVGAGETADWFAESTGGTVLASGDNVLSYSTAAAGTYYAAAQNTTTGCSSASRTGVTLNVNASPAAPTVTTPVSYCQGVTATTLTATPTGSNTLNWYSAAPSYPAVTGATALGSSPTPSTSTAGTTNYYVSQSSSANSCESQLALVAVTVNAIPSAPVASNPAAYCLNDPAATALTATATAGNTLYWYTVPTGGTGSATAPIPSTAAAGTTDYYVADRTNASGCEGSRTTVTVTVNPTITASVSNSASSTSACGGGSITFTATPTNGGTPTYQWYLNNNPVGSNSATYTLASPNNADAIYVAMTPSAQTCLASNAATPSNTVTLTSTAATPTVSIQSSASTAFCPGTSVTFSVNASANMGAAPSYQWNLNGTPIDGAPNATLVTTSLANNDQVTLTMTSSLGGACLTQADATSSAITSTVNSSTAISAQPAAAAACLGGSASFTVSATGTGTLTYQWKKNGSNVSGNATATSSTLTLSGIAAGDAANYSVDVTGTCGTVTSSAAALTINSATAISTQPSAASDCAGATVNFSVTASGEGTLTYQWRKDGSALNGETNATLALTNISSANAGQYSVIVSGGCGNVTSSNALLAINAATVISTQPLAATLCAGNTANFSVTASGTGTLSYQWKKDGSNVGTNSSSLSVTNAQSANAGDYTVDVTGTCGTVTSSTALLTVNPLTTITTQPVAAFGCQGQSSTFTVVAAGTSPLTYQWKFVGVNISGATAASYNIPNAAPENDGAYFVTVTGGCGAAVNSNTVVLDVYPTSVAGTVGSNQAICSGNSPADLTLSGNTGTIQWQSSSDNSTFADINGATASTLTSAETGTLNATTYYRAIITSGSCSSVTTNTVTVTVTASPSAGTISGTQAVCSNGTTQFVSTGDAGGTWTSSSEAVSTVNSSGLVTAVSAGTATITYTVSGTGGCTASATRTVTVTAAPNAGTISGTQAICSNGTTTFTTSGNAGGSWTSSDEGVATINSVSGVITPVAAGTSTITYTVAGSGGCNAAASTRTVTVTAAPNAGTITGTTTICQIATAQLETNGNVGGTWSSSNSSAASVSPSGLISGVAAGVSTISYTVTGTGGCSNAIASTTFTVNGTPSTPSVSVADGCGLSTLSFTPASNATIAWSNGGTTASTTSTTNATLTVTQTVNGCLSSAGSGSAVPLVVPTAPTATASQNFCITDNATVASLAYTNVAGNTYTWYDAATAGNTVATSTPLPTATTNYYLAAIGSNGCSSLTRTAVAATETALALATVSIVGTTTCPGGEITFTATPANGGNSPTYQWYNGGVPILNATGNTYIATGLTEGDLITVKMIPSGSCVTVCPN